MVYVCEDCAFLFRRDSEPEEHPSCGKKWLRMATEEEKQRLLAVLRQGGAAINRPRVGMETGSLPLHRFASNASTGESAGRSFKQ